MLDFIFNSEDIPGKIKTAITNALKKKGWEWEGGELIKQGGKDQSASPLINAELGKKIEEDLETLLKQYKGEKLPNNNAQMWRFVDAQKRDEFLKAAGIDLSVNERINLSTVGLSLKRLVENVERDVKREEKREKIRKEEIERQKEERRQEKLRRGKRVDRGGSYVDRFPPLGVGARDNPGGIDLEGIARDINPRPSSSPINLSPALFSPALFNNGLSVEIIQMKEMGPNELNQFVLGSADEKEKGWPKRVNLEG